MAQPPSAVRIDLKAHNNILLRPKQCNSILTVLRTNNYADTVPKKTAKEKQPASSQMPDAVKEYIKELGRIGGKKRSQNLTPERRREIAQKAAQTRWAQKSKKRT